MQQYIGYYNWDGTPCEIRAMADDAGIEAFYYVAADAANKVSVVDVLYKAEPISLKKFQQLLQDL